MKIFITGGTGHLGQKLIEYLSNDHDVYSPDKNDCNILNASDLKIIINSFRPDVVIHLAAFVDTFGCEKDIQKALDINVIGTINMVKACSNIKCKFVYVSSEYVFGGNKGNYTIDDKLDPINVYGKTKAASEYIVSVLSNYQIIRAPFIKQVYPKVFSDQYCSRYFLDEIVEKISNNIFNNSSKLVHIASERMSLYELYVKKGIKADPILIDEEQLKIIPHDTSLINNSI
jgi:dTDP-4-dehydrorhamnose reductase